MGVHQEQEGEGILKVDALSQEEERRARRTRSRPGPTRRKKKRGHRLIVQIQRKDRYPGIFPSRRGEKGGSANNKGKWFLGARHPTMTPQCAGRREGPAWAQGESKVMGIDCSQRNLRRKTCLMQREGKTETDRSTRLPKRTRSRNIRTATLKKPW